MYLVITHMPGESYHRRFRSLWLYLCYVFWVLINSLDCWFCMSSLGLIVFQIRICSFHLSLCLSVSVSVSVSLSLSLSLSKLFFKLFGCQIQPVLTYGSEVLGLIANNRIIGRIHLFAIKRSLNVSPRTPNSPVYGETGRYPLYISTYMRCIKYWLNILRMQEDWIPLKSYKMLYNVHCNNKNNWASSICFTLYRYGYEHVWENQGLCDIRAFLCEFKQRLIDGYLQGWNRDINSKDRYTFFPSFKQTHGLSQYLLTVKNVTLKRNLARLRLGVYFFET